MKTNADAIKIIRESSYCVMSLASAERWVKKLVTHPINEYQFSALVSLICSIGVQEFKKSTVLAMVNKGQFLVAALHFGDYTTGENAEDNKHLKRRRRKEKRMFTTPTLEINTGITPRVK
jgi:GH24 family phage-related lysozyme (muramidase)